MFNRKIFEWSEKKGYRVGVGGIDLLQRVERELEQRKANKEIDPGFYEENLGFTSDYRNCEAKDSISVIIVAVPRPAHIIGFELGSKLLEMVLPPTYKDYRRLFETTRLDLENQVFAGRIQIEPLSAPLKAIASLIGVVSYGRNNLAYTPEFGSYLQLAGFLANTSLLETKSVEQDGRCMLQECNKCRACIKACPMGVICDDRFLIRAEKCYTLYSESPLPLPAGISPPSPSCIIGCMRCQEVCPANKGRLKYVYTDVSFSSEETLAILDSGSMDPDMLRAIEAKFVSLGLTEGADIFFRNFRKVMEAHPQC